jgi:AcrR family transcriptional regulator
MNTKEAIFNKSIELFAAYSYNATSIRHICREVGIKESSFYNHFSSKNQLLESILEHFNNLLLSTHTQESVIEQLTEKYSLRDLLNYALNENIQTWNNIQTNQIWFILNTEQYSNPDAAKIIIQEDERRIEKSINLFKHLQLKNKMKEYNPKILAYSYIYAMKSLHYEYSLRKLHKLECDFIISTMFEICNSFCSIWEINN